MKLVMLQVATTLTVDGGIGRLDRIKCADPEERWRGWRVSVRGPAVFLISPRGWASGLAAHDRDATGPMTIVEMPRTSCVLSFQSDDVDAIDKLQKYDSPPFDRPRSEPAISDEELERATAPKAKR